MPTFTSFPYEGLGYIDQKLEVEDVMKAEARGLNYALNICEEGRKRQRQEKHPYAEEIYNVEYDNKNKRKLQISIICISSIEGGRKDAPEDQRGLTTEAWCHPYGYRKGLLEK